MRTLVQIPKPFLILILVFIFMWAFISLEYYPTWDAAFYYGYTRSILFDGDLKLENDLQLSYPTASDDFVNRGIDQRLTKTGRVAAPYALGSSLIWLPLFAILKVGATAAHWIGWLPANVSGFEWYFSLTVAALSAILGLLAFWLGHLVAEQENGRWSALVATLTLLFTTPLIYYQFREPLYSHATSAFLNSLVVFLWWRSYRLRPSSKNALILGSAIGLTTLVRWQNLAYLILPFVSTIWWWIDSKSSGSHHSWKRVVSYLGLVGLTTLAFATIQISHWRIVYGSWLTVPQGGAYVDWSATFLTEVLFSPFRGLFPWMPIALLAVAGLAIMGREKARLIVPLVLLLILSLYVNSSTLDWFGGGGYGPRRFSSELAIFIVGYSGLIQAIPVKARKLTSIFVGAGLVLHQWTLFRFGIEEKIGGRVVSMYPDYRWEESTYSELLQSLVKHIPDAFTSPRDYFVLRNSPVSELLDGRWPARHLYALLLTASFLLAMWLISRYIARKRLQSNVFFWLVTIAVAIMIILTNVWILNKA